MYLLEHLIISVVSHCQVLVIIALTFPLVPSWTEPIANFIAESLPSSHETSKTESLILRVTPNARVQC